MNLASKTAPVSVDQAVEGRRHPAMTGCRTLLLNVRDGMTGLRSYQRRLRSSVTTPSWTIRLPTGPRLGLAALFLPQADQRLLVGP